MQGSETTRNALIMSMEYCRQKAKSVGRVALRQETLGSAGRPLPFSAPSTYDVASLHKLHEGCLRRHVWN